jgi:hypothetical protein
LEKKFVVVPRSCVLRSFVVPRLEMNFKRMEEMNMEEMNMEETNMVEQKKEDVLSCKRNEHGCPF